MKIMVTGHRGFVGTHLRKALGEVCFGVDTWSSSDFDICQMDWSAFDDMDVVYHLAAVTDALTEDHELVMQTNVVATERLMRAFGPRLVFASSSMAAHRGNVYGMSKKLGEEMAREYGCHVARFCNLHGRGGHSCVDAFQRARAQNTSIEIRGNGMQLRTYAPVSSAVDLLLRLGGFAAMAGSPPVWDVLPGQDLTVLQVAALYAPGCPVGQVPAHPRDLPYAPQRPF